MFSLRRKIIFKLSSIPPVIWSADYPTSYWSTALKSMTFNCGHLSMGPLYVKLLLQCLKFRTSWKGKETWLAPDEGLFMISMRYPGPEI